MNSESCFENIKLAISIVNWRTSELVGDCLISLASEIDKSIHVIVVDNGSGDGSEESIAELIRSRGWGWVTLIPLPENRGFAAGNNAAIRFAKENFRKLDSVMLLNPDTLVLPKAVGTMMEFLKSNPEVGIVGGRSEHLDGTPQDCSFRFYNLISEFCSNFRFARLNKLLDRYMNNGSIPEIPTEVDWVSGAFMLIRKQVLDEIGLMDEAYFLYFEETDFTIRARKRGWQCWHLPEARVVHLVGQSSGVTDKTLRSARRPAYWYESRSRYFLVNHGRLYAIGCDALAVFGSWLFALRCLFARKANPNPPYFLRDLVQFGTFGVLMRTRQPRVIS
ncbi:MAG: glycosyltransferase family 2 protein [Pseudomonadaceae bacterium]|nr:glycosyltransferase family 2 protein [Pseudomonadaceae bacterium]